MQVEYNVINTAKGDLVIRTFNGRMDKDAIISSFNYLLDNNLLKADSFGLITDISNADLDLDMLDLENITKFIFSNDILSKIKLAIVAHSANKLTLTTLANFKLGDYLMPFSSIERAKDWIIL